MWPNPRLTRTSFKPWRYLIASLLVAVASFALFSALGPSPFAATAPTATQAPVVIATHTPTLTMQPSNPIVSGTNGTPTARTPTGREAAINSIRACLDKSSLEVRYRSTGHPSPHPELILDFYEVGRFYVEVDTRTNQVLSVSPGGDLPRTGSPAPFDLTPRYTPQQLETMARAFIARCAKVNVDPLTPNHTRSPTDTESINYFFRWEDRSRIIDSSVFPFVQVGFTRGGDLLGYTDMFPYPSSPVPTAVPTTPDPAPTAKCWGSLSPMPTATPTPPRILMTRTPGLPVVFPCGSALNRQGWLTHTGTGITQTNRAILDLHPNVKPPVLTFMYPPSWRLLGIRTGFGRGNYADHTYTDFALMKHELGIPESRGETPTTSDVSIHFVLVLEDASPDDYDSTRPLGFDALGMVIEHGMFNGYRAMFAYIGNTQRGFQRHVLFQVSPGVLILISVDFPLIEGSSPPYVQQTLAELDGIMGSVRVSPSAGTR